MNTDLSELLERVKAATGPDWKIERAICIELNELVAPYTASIDAALALVERLLPDHDWLLGHTNGGLTIHCQLGPDADKMAFGATPALAVLSALLQALGEKP